MAPGPSITRPHPTSASGSGRSNTALLTEGSRYFARAKRAREDRVEKVVFDDTARRDWLTGFSKRKQAKTEVRKAKAKARDHAEHLEERKKVRRAVSMGSRRMVC